MDIPEAVRDGLWSAKRDMHEPDTMLMHPQDRVRLLTMAQRWMLQCNPDCQDQVLGMRVVTDTAMPEGTIRFLETVAERTFER